MGYSFTQDSLKYLEFTNEPEMAVSKAVPLSVFGTGDTSKIESEFIKEQKFILGTDSQDPGLAKAIWRAHKQKEVLYRSNIQIIFLQP